MRRQLHFNELRFSLPQGSRFVRLRLKLTLRLQEMNFTSLANKYVCDVPVYEPGRPIEEVARTRTEAVRHHQAGVERKRAQSLPVAGASFADD